MDLGVVEGDLARTAADVLVNAANPALLGGGGVDGALHDAAGPALLAACRALPEVRPGVRCPTGSARLTGAYGLPARHVVHAVGPVHGRDPDPPAALAGALRAALALAVAAGARTVAVPALSTGAYGYPLREAAAVLVGVARERGWALDRLTFVTFGVRARDAFAAALARPPAAVPAPDPPAFRRATPDDEPALARIVREVMTSFGACGSGFAIVDPEVDHLATAYAAERHAYFAVARAGRVVGGGGIGPLQGADATICELRKMYFLPEARGRGDGARLLDQALTVARGYGFRTAYLETLTGMDAAQRLYARAGFRPLGAPLGATGHSGCDRWYARDL